MAVPKGVKATLRTLKEIKELEKELGLKPKPYDSTKQGTWESQRSNRITKTLSNRRKRATPEQREKEYEKRREVRAVKGEEIRKKERKAYKRPHVKAGKAKHSALRRGRLRGANVIAGILGTARDIELDEIRRFPGIFNWRDTFSAPSESYSEGKRIPYFETEHYKDIAKGGGDWDVKKDRPNIYSVDRPTHADITRATERGKHELAQGMKDRARLPTVTGPARKSVITSEILKKILRRGGSLMNPMAWPTMLAGMGLLAFSPEESKASMVGESLVAASDPLMTVLSGQRLNRPREYTTEGGWRNQLGDPTFRQKKYTTWT